MAARRWLLALLLLWLALAAASAERGQSAFHGGNKPHAVHGNRTRVRRPGHGPPGAAAPAPLCQAPDGKEAEKGLTRNLVQPRGARRGAGQRPGASRRLRRPRPRLSHKGPMPF